MALLPDTSNAPNGTTIQVSTQETYPNKTYKMRIEEERIDGTVTDELDAVRQAVYKILNTERYRYVIYNDNFSNRGTSYYSIPYRTFNQGKKT